MALFGIGLLLILAGILALAAGGLVAAALGVPRMGALAGGVGGIVIGVVMVTLSSAIYVEDNQGGVVVVKFGADLKDGKIVATDGEKGPQAGVLPPGWHFGYWPFIYELEAVDNVEIPQGKLGIVKAKDGAALPEGEIFASAWDSPKQMLDGMKFLKDGPQPGVKGPQLTVLKPGQYRYNPRLFEVQERDMLEVPVGTVAVIKANAGLTYEDSDDVELVNGVPIVPRGYRGIWREVYTPDAYYLHPDAYVVTRVATTNRIYSYSDQEAIDVRTKDGFEFPVDVRVSVKISAQNAPYVVASLADPDAKSRVTDYTILEERVILPLVRAIFRNTAENRNALQFVNQRSEIEQVATEELQKGLQEYQIDTDGVYVADIRIGETEAGRELLKTQTDKEVALNQQATFAEQERAQQARAESVRAEEEANQQVQQAQARSRVIIAQEDAKAAVTIAQGEAAAFAEKINALGGVDVFVQLELAQLMVQRWTGAVPSVMVAGGDGGGLDALIGSMLKHQQEQKAE